MSGFFGSASTTRPSLKLKFDKYIDEQLYEVDDHVALNDASPMRSPAQALNAVTVGACTHLVEDDEPVGHIAVEGDLCPTSRTGLAWVRPMLCNKPDIVMEGGNRVAIQGSALWPPVRRVLAPVRVLRGVVLPHLVCATGASADFSSWHVCPP
mgnify:CR=1 FL=1